MTRLTRLIRPVTSLSTSIVIVGLVVAGCRRADSPSLGLATPSVIVNRDRAPAGSPVEITYKFVMTSDAVMDRVVAAMQRSSFEIIATNLSKDQEQELREAFSRA